MLVFFCWFGVRFDLNKKIRVDGQVKKVGFWWFVDVLLMVTDGV